MERFKLDAEQTDAILELKIYRLARLEILVIQQELAEKRKRAKEIGGLLKEQGRTLGDRPKIEIEEIQKTYGDARRSEISSAKAKRSTPPRTSSSRKTTSSSSRATAG